MADSTNVLELSEADFQTEVENGSGLAMVDFWAEWCGPCRMVAPVVSQLADEYADRITVGKVDVDEQPGTASKYGIRSIPSILFFKDGQLVDSVIGAVPKPHLQQKIEQHLG